MSYFKTYLSNLFDSQRGRNIMLYLLFVVISFIFWVLMTLNNEVQKDYRVVVNLTEVPDSVTIISDIPKEIRVSVSDKGATFLPYMFGTQPTVNLKWKDYVSSDGYFNVPRADIRSEILNMFGGGTVSITSIVPDEILAKYTNLPGKSVPLVIDAYVEPNIQYVQSGKLKSDIDSVCVYGDNATLSEIDSVYTYYFELKDLKDTVYREVKIMPRNGVKIIPDKITVTVPVEQLIAKNVEVPIISRGVPEQTNIITFPSKIGLKYLVPMSQYSISQNMMAEVYYIETFNNENKLKLYLNHINWPFGYEFEQDSVEYIIEK